MSQSDHVTINHVSFSWSLDLLSSSAALPWQEHAFKLQGQPWKNCLHAWSQVVSKLESWQDCWQNHHFSLQVLPTSTISDGLLCPSIHFRLSWRASWNLTPLILCDNQHWSPTRSQIEKCSHLLYIHTCRQPSIIRTHMHLQKTTVFFPGPSWHCENSIQMPPPPRP